MKRFLNIIGILLLGCLLFTASSCSFIKTPEPSKDYSAVTAEKLSIGGYTKYHFEQLSNVEKHAYNNILSSVKTFSEKIEIPVLTQEGLNAVYTALLNDNPELFFLDNSYSAENHSNVAFFYPKYSMTPEDYEAMYRNCVEAANEIVKKASEYQFAFDKERVVHDEIIKNCEYSNNTDNIYRNSIYGVLIYKSASCEGYAKTSKYLFDLLKMESYVITGNSYSPTGELQAHMWNIINLGGNYYHLDLTWDDPVTEDGLPMTFYTYFNVSDEVIGKTHFDFDHINLCFETADYFFNYKRLMFDGFGREDKRLTAEFAADVISNGSHGFQICFETREAFDEAVYELLEEEEIYALLEDIKEISQMEFPTDRVAYVLNEDYNIIEIIIDSLSEV